MYQDHFGLDRRIFRGNVAGADVFVGPQTAKILSGIKKALAAPDAVVTVTGPVGAGKSTAVAHSLGAISGKNAVVRVGRFPLQRGEILDLLFDHMRIQQRPPRGNQKLALFRQLLFNLAQNNSRMFILVEDAPYLGENILSELEVLTAADTGPSDGANIVLMGDESLREILSSKVLARMRQRIRLRRTLDSCSVEELAGYLRHCFRQAGGEFDHIFDDGAVTVLHELSGGILRVVNNLVESSMEAAAEMPSDTVDVELIGRVANEEFGLTGTFTTPPQIVNPEPEPKLTDEATAELVALSLPDAMADLPKPQPEPEPEPLPEPEPDPKAQIEPEPEPQPEPEPAVQVEPEPEPASSQERRDEIPELIQDTQPALSILPDAPEPDPVPELIQDTLPNLAVLSPELAEQAAAAPKPATPDSSQNPAAEKGGDRATETEAEKPDWDRDPTLAELRPDLDALERAMAVAQGRDADTEDYEEVPPPVEDRKNATLTGVPEITLDDSISRKVDAAALESKERLEEESDIDEEEVDPEAEAEAAAKKEKRASAELEKIAVGLAQAKTIEDVDDKMAETLFGEELNVAAAAVAARVAEETAAADAAKAEEATQADPAPAANGSSNPLEKEFEKVWGETPGVEVSIESQIEGQSGGLDISASQRLATVRALSADKQPEASSPAANDTPPRPVSKPDSIEEQITTSMTQTMKALNVTPNPTPVNDDDDDEEEKGGFFSRFRR